MSIIFRIFVSNKKHMNIQTLYSTIADQMGNDVKSFILTPNFYFNRYKQTGYMNRMNDLFMGVREENVKGSKYVTTLFLREFKTGEYVREEIFVDGNYNVLDVKTTRG